MHFSRSSFLLAAAAICALAAPLEERQGRYCTDPGNEPGGVPNCRSIVVYAARGTENGNFNSNVVSPNYDELPVALEDIARAVIDKAGGNGVCRAMRYPAAACNGTNCAPYWNSIAFGIDVGQAFIRNYTAKCGANARVVLIGYSQGAQTMTSVLVGEDVDQDMYAPTFFGVTNPPIRRQALATGLRRTVVGATLISSPSFLPNFRPIDAGDSGSRGVAYKKDYLYQDFNNTWGSITRNYCNGNDGFCASNFSDLLAGAPNHGAAPGTFRDAAIAFLRSLGLAT